MVYGRCGWCRHSSPSLNSFYTKSIRQAFCSSAIDYGITGFLMPGKPAVACLEGTDAAIRDFLRHVRTVLFAVVPAASRKMQTGLIEDSGPVKRLFPGRDDTAEG